MAGQVVMEGFLNFRMRPWLRRMITRMIAIVPAVVVTIWAGEKATGQLLILSQVVLSIALPVPMIALLILSLRRSVMGEFASGRLAATAAALGTATGLALNAVLLLQIFGVAIPGLPPG